MNYRLGIDDEGYIIDSLTRSRVFDINISDIILSVEEDLNNCIGFKLKNFNLKLESRFNELEKRLSGLETHVEYMPNGNGMKKAESHFETVSKK